MIPEFRLDSGGYHVHWTHDCLVYEGQERVPLRVETVLPINDVGWEIVQVDPITVIPSILCGSCGTHGFIASGRWVDL